MSSSAYGKIPFGMWFDLNQEDLRGEFEGEVDTEVIEQCTECDGKGYVRCNFDHEHDCEECGGEGEWPTEKSFQVYAEDMYHEQVVHDARKFKDYRKFMKTL